MNKVEKKEFIDSLKSSISSASIVVLSNQISLSVAESNDLRRKMRSSGASFKIVKNSLAKIAFKDLPCNPLADYLVGPTAVSYSEDPVSAAKVLVKFAETNKKIKVLCGTLNGEFLDIKSVEQLAKLPSLGELKGKLVCLLNAPALGVARVVRVPSEQIARVFSAYGNK